MASVSLYTRSKIEKNKDTDITIGVAVRDTNINLKLSTGLKVPSKYWNAKENNIIERYVNAPSEIVARLDIVKSYLNSITSKVWARIEEHGGLESMELKTIISDVLEGKKDSRIPTRMNDYIAFVIEQMKSGERKASQGGNYADGSIKSWNSFYKNWLEFQNEFLERYITFKDVSLNTYNSFLDYFIYKQYTAKTTKKYISILIAAMNYGYMDEVHTNIVYKDRRFTKNIKDVEVEKVYLTEAEIDAIYNLELVDEMQDKVRDLFLIGYYTAQRVSDYSAIKRANIVQLSSGNLAYETYQQKTKNKVSVPLIDRRAINILEKWNYSLPTMGGKDSTHTLINRYIKGVCKLAGITQDFTKEEMRGQEIISYTVPKYTLVTSHTARRSAITNLYKADFLSESEIMLISGHKTREAFNTYICLTVRELTERVAIKMSNHNNPK